MSDIKNAWIRTYSGKNFNPFDTKTEDINIEDVARSLSQISRFNGHTKFPYTVGQHCIAVCTELCMRDYDDETCLFGLLHDASEAYMTDMPKPIKEMFPTLMSIEKILQDKIYTTLIGKGPNPEQFEAIDKIDKESAYLEAINITDFPDWIPYTPEFVVEHSYDYKDSLDIYNNFMGMYTFLRVRIHLGGLVKNGDDENCKV